MPDDCQAVVPAALCGAPAAWVAAVAAVVVGADGADEGGEVAAVVVVVGAAVVVAAVVVVVGGSVVVVVVSDVVVVGADVVVVADAEAACAPAGAEGSAARCRRAPASACSGRGRAVIARIVTAGADRRGKSIWCRMTCESAQTFPDLGVACGHTRVRRAHMSRLIRMDRTGHTTLAEWSAGDPAAVQAALRAFRAELDQGYFAVVSRGEGDAEQIRALPVDAPLVILRRPIAGG